MPAPAPPAPPSRLKRALLPVLLLLSAGTFVAALLVPVPGRNRLPGPQSVEAPPPEVPDFAMTERSGKTVTKTDLLGKVWVASFVFTRCDGPCPRVAGNVYQLQQQLPDRPDLKLVTFTMDPEFDTPAVLSKYAAQPTRPADPDRWLFLTANSEAEVHRLMKDHFRQAIAKNPPTEPAGKKFNHGTYLFVVDKQGRIRGHFAGFQGEHDEDGSRLRDGLDRLKQTVTTLLAE